MPIPTLNGELRLAKPPLPTWSVAALQHLTGLTENLGLLRVPAALAASLLVFFFWGLARELTRNRPEEAQSPGRTAWFGALVLASSLLVITVGREGQWDIFATSFMVGALWLLVKGWQQPVNGLLPLLGAGVLAGLSILSKGPVAVYAVLFPFLLGYLIGQPDHRRLVAHQRRNTALAVAVALVVGFAWPFYIWLHVAPAALHVAQTEINSWSERHVKPLWYYWSFFAFTGLWTLVCLASLVVPYARRRASRFIPYGVALGWLVAGLVLLSLVPEKKERYMLPLMPALAFLISGLLRYWENRPLSPNDRRIVLAWGSLLVVLLAGLPVALAMVHLPGLEAGSVRFALAVGLFGLLAIWVVGRGLRRQQPVVLVAATLSATAAILLLLMPIYPIWEARKDYPGLRHMRDVRNQPALARLEWRSLDDLHVKQIWLAGRPIPRWKPDLASLASLSAPVVVFSPGPIQERFPLGWQQVATFTPLDTFYLGREKDSGSWFVSRIDPIRGKSIKQLIAR
ncbi:hypothetical protein GCM10027346_02330 [Hymenobacter seoulensis]